MGRCLVGSLAAYRCERPTQMYSPTPPQNKYLYSGAGGIRVHILSLSKNRGNKEESGARRGAIIGEFSAESVSMSGGLGCDGTP